MVSTAKQFGHEKALLVSCATLPEYTRLQEKYDWKQISSSIDWQLVLQFAAAHGTTALLSFNLRHMKDVQVPEAILQVLKQHDFQLAARNLHMVGQLFFILDLLKTYSVPVIAFKGPILAILAYENLSMRYFCDLDLLIRAEDFPRVHNLLLLNGFQAELAVTSSELKAMAKHENEMAFINDTTGITIDLHWELSRHYLSDKLNFEYYSDRLQTVSLSGREIRTLGAEDLIVYLCLHGAKHGWQRLEWLGNLSALINRQDKLDWEKIIELSCEIRALRIILLGLALVDEFFTVQLPSHLKNKIQNDRQLPLLRNLVIDNLFSKTEAIHPLEVRFSRFHFLIRDNWFGKVLYGARLLFVPSKEDWNKVRLPACLSFLYYLIRPLRLGWLEMRKKLA